MSAIVVVCLEGVLSPDGERIPNASPLFSGLQLAHALSQAWQVGFVSQAPTGAAVAWLREAKAPSWCWVAQAHESERAAVILRQLAERQDRAKFVFAGDPEGFEQLNENGVTTMLVAHSGSFTTGDWRQPSTWADSEPVDEEE